MFHDSSGSNGFSIVLAACRNDRGTFTFDVLGVGSYKGQAAVEDTGNHHQQVDKDAEDKGDHHQQADKDAADPVVLATHSVMLAFWSDASKAHTTVAGSIEGIVDPVKHTATVTLVLRTRPSVTYHLHSGAGNANDAVASAQEFGAAMVRPDYGAVYDLSASEATKGYTRTTFAQLFTSHPGPVLTRAVLSGPGQMGASGGRAYFVQPMALTAVDNGVRRTYTTKVQLVWENDRWLVLLTDVPS